MCLRLWFCNVSGHPPNPHYILPIPRQKQNCQRKYIYIYVCVVAVYGWVCGLVGGQNMIQNRNSDKFDICILGNVVFGNNGHFVV